MAIGSYCRKEQPNAASVLQIPSWTTVHRMLRLVHLGCKWRDGCTPFTGALKLPQKAEMHKKIKSLSLSLSLPISLSECFKTPILKLGKMIHFYLEV